MSESSPSPSRSPGILHYIIGIAKDPYILQRNHARTGSNLNASGPAECEKESKLIVSYGSWACENSEVFLERRISVSISNIQTRAAPAISGMSVNRRGLRATICVQFGSSV